MLTPLQRAVWHLWQGGLNTVQITETLRRAQYPGGAYKFRGVSEGPVHHALREVLNYRYHGGDRVEQDDDRGLD